MIYHFFLVDFKSDSGYMYRVGIACENGTQLKDVKDYLQAYANEVLYEKTSTEVKKRYLKTMRETPVGKIFMTKFLFDKDISVPYDHWSCRLRRKLLPRQKDEVFIEND